MAYCTITHVQGHNPKRTYSATSTPTTTQVQEFIDRIANEIDVVLGGRGFTVPVTSPTELANFLIQVNAYGAAALAEDAMFPETTVPGATPHSVSLWSKYQAALKYLGEANLPVNSDGVALPFSFRGQKLGETSEPTDDYDWQKSKFGINKEF